MNRARPLTVVAVAACVLALPGTAAATDHYGGAPAEPLASDAQGGGIMAPAEEPAAGAEAEAALAGDTAPGQAAQEETPTTPEGEEQPPEQEENGEQVPTEENGGDDEPSLEDGAGEAPADTGGGLPRTGFELVALTMIGLGLLLAGGALWPTSSWPPPRNRLSRSAPRR